MRIEILTNGKDSVSVLQKKFKNLQDSISDTILDLQKINTDINNAHGGVGRLSGAVSCLNARIRAEKAKEASAASVSNLTGSFLQNTLQTDRVVANRVAQSQEKFFNNYSWLRPAAAGEKGVWENIVEGWKNFWVSVQEKITGAWIAIKEFVKKYAVKLIVGTIGIIVAVAALVITGMGFLAALGAVLVVVAITMIVTAVIDAGFAFLKDDDISEAFIGGLMSGYMLGWLGPLLSKIGPMFKLLFSKIFNKSLCLQVPQNLFKDIVINNLPFKFNQTKWKKLLKSFTKFGIPILDSECE